MAFLQIQIFINILNFESIILVLDTSSNVTSKYATNIFINVFNYKTRYQPPPTLFPAQTRSSNSVEYTSLVQST